MHTRVGPQKTRNFSAISGISKWNLPEFLYHTFRYQDENGKPVHQTTEHAAIVSRFLQGRTKYTPAMVLDAWFRGPDGSISKDSVAFYLMYSAVVPFMEIGPVRHANNFKREQLQYFDAVRHVMPGWGTASQRHGFLRSVKTEYPNDGPAIKIRLGCYGSLWLL